MRESHPIFRAVAAPAALLTGLLTAGAAAADCVDGVRAATTAEQEFSARAAAALAAALPRAAAPLSLAHAADVAARARSLSLCAGTAIGGFEVSTGATYVRTFTPAEAATRDAKRRALEQRMEEMKRLPPELQARQDELLRQAKAVYDTVPRRSRKDPPFTPEQQAIVDQRSAEGRALEDRARAVEHEHVRSLEAQLKPLRDEASALQNSPQQLAVQLLVNAPEYRLRDIGDAQVASFGPMLKRPGGGLAVKQVAVIVRGPAGIARQAVLDGIDQAYLKSLLGQPLPSVEESTARASRAATITVPLEAETQVAASPAASPEAGASTTSAASAPVAAAGAGAAATSAAASPTPAAATNPKCVPRDTASASAAAGAVGSTLGGDVGRVLGGLASLGRSKKPPSDCP
ncbi:MAG: hypothetical protein O9284_18335 [Steroidobacteraceae bacterium]|jgi:hypothetical protein|nr:hypothetical protein [Steroidobacteraceae bacterium]